VLRSKGREYWWLGNTYKHEPTLSLIISELTEIMVQNGFVYWWHSLLTFGRCLVRISVGSIG